MLKKGVVPSIFNQYPSHLRPAPTKSRDDSSIKKRKREGSPVGTVHSPEPGPSGMTAVEAVELYLTSSESSDAAGTVFVKPLLCVRRRSLRPLLSGALVVNRFRQPVIDASEQKQHTQLVCIQLEPSESTGCAYAAAWFEGSQKKYCWLFFNVCPHTSYSSFTSDRAGADLVTLQETEPGPLEVTALDAGYDSVINRQGRVIYACRLCNKTFQNYSNLKRHIKLHDPVQEYFPCSLCQRKYGRKDTLKGHMKQAHGVVSQW
ncbi:hypothetical protein V5799_015098 [Amblyomma americanum]|uniref:C2H2-type domain-containing protein n=1 Tax=Amblyomma americanum TaxID=6943 RepID=A0AAQ4E146_AMBAM